MSRWTTPPANTITAGTPAAAELGTLLREEDPLSEDALVRAAGLVEEAGGKRWTENQAAAQLAAAHRCLAETPMPDGHLIVWPSPGPSFQEVLTRPR